MQVIENMQEAMMLLKQRRASLEFHLGQIVCKFLDENPGVNIQDITLDIDRPKFETGGELVRRIGVKVTLSV